MIDTAYLSKLSDVVSDPIVCAFAKRYAVALRTPGHFVEMLFLVEDKRFPIHLGVDPIAIGRALIFNSQGRTLQGASTIVQQVYTIRECKFRLPDRTLGQKIDQSAWALMHSLNTPKVSILREYVETVYWGRSYRGLDSAARGYLNAFREHLSPEQSFFLAERIATPNRVSVARISNLLQRSAISRKIRSGGVQLSGIVRIYDQVYGCGGELWQTLAK